MFIVGLLVGLMVGLTVAVGAFLVGRGIGIKRERDFFINRWRYEQ